MRNLNFQIYFITLFALFGCSQGAVEKTPEVTIPSLPPGQSDASRMIDQATVSCDKVQDCSGSTGMLLSDDGGNGDIGGSDGVLPCTATLITSDTLMTGAQCIPADLRASKSDCSGRIWVKFPAVGGLVAESEECSIILKTTTYVSGANDQVNYAFIKLKSPAKRIPMPMSFGGFKDQQKFTVFKVDFTVSANQIHGSMGRESCESNQRSLALPEFDRSDAPVVSLAGCDVLPGDSGAPLVDERGQVHGVIQDGKASTFDPEALQPYLLGTSYQTINFGTNLACMSSKDVFPNRLADPACGPDTTASDAAPALSNLKTILQPELNNERKNFVTLMSQASLSPHVQWSSGDMPATSSLLASDVKAWGNYGVFGLSAVPTCIDGLDSWIQKYSAGVLGMKRAADEELTLPVVIYRLGMNQDEVADFLQVSSTMISATLHFNPQEVFHRRSGTFEVHIQKPASSGQTGDEILFSVNIKECTELGPSSR